MVLKLKCKVFTVKTDTIVIQCALFGILDLAKAAQPHLKTFWGHARVELGPPKISQWPEIRKGFYGIYNKALSGEFLDSTVSQATRNSLVTLEVLCWFYVGEIIGRRSIIGYKV